MYINCQLKMEKYREKSLINADTLACYMHGSKAEWEFMGKLEAECKEHGLVPDYSAAEKSRVDQYEIVHKFGEMFKKVKAIDFMAEDVKPRYLFLSNLHTKGGVGFLMALHTIKCLGTQEQVDNWATKIANKEWYGCYVQTELGHGSDVQNLKTVAVYDHKTQDFTIHTPDVDAIKWWPGDLGMSATHAILMTKIVSNGKNQGIFPLFIQIRDLETHRALDGLELGDIGPKLGYASKDNGFMRFNHFKVPKSALLGKFYQIDNEGNIKIIGNPKIIYSSMLESRTGLLEVHMMGMFKALQTVGRYSCLRKQFTDTEGNEIPIIEYQMQKEKILKHLSRGYAMVFAKQKLAKFLTKNSEAVKKYDFSYLQEAHVNLCGYKAYFTWSGINCYAEMIQAAGGHGFSYYSGLPEILTELFPDTILEGENTLLCLQVARHLLKTMSFLEAESLDKIKGSTQYFKKFQSLMDMKLPEEKVDLCKHDVLLSALARVCCYFVKETAVSMMTHLGNGLDPKEAWNTKMGMKLLNIGKLHTVHTIGYESISQVATLSDKTIRDTINDVLLYFIIEIIEEYFALFLQSSTLNQDQIAVLREKREELTEMLSPHLLKLCEGFQYTDHFLHSAIGHSNGKPYENLYEWAKKYGSLNRYSMEGHPAVHQYKL